MAGVGAAMGYCGVLAFVLRTAYNPLMPDDDHDRPLHVYPLDDVAEHVLLGLTCPCHPREREENGQLIIVHNLFTLERPAPDELPELN